jgi:chlorophyll synthase
MKAITFLVAVIAGLQADAFSIGTTRVFGAKSLKMTANKDFFPFRNEPVRSMTELSAAPKGKDSGADSAARQLLGIKGASESKNIWAIRLQLCKPVTWIPLIWGVACGAAASGNYHTWNPFGSGDVPASLIAEDALKAAACMVLAGPILTGYTQTLNDWEDRAIDAINEPYRPIPSGAISEGQVLAQIWTLFFSGIAVAYGLDQWAGHADPVITELTIFGIFIAYIYSAPPLKLKQNGWTGSFALGSSYISLPWLCGQAMFGELSWPVTVLTIFYSLAGLGIAIVNDFKSIEGDR